MFMEKLKELRSAKGMTQSQLGEYIGAKKSAVCLWESGKRQPDQETLVRLASFFSVTVDYLLGNDDVVVSKTETAPAPDARAEAKRLLEGLSDDQYQAALQYLQFLKAQKE
jgi:transcriptional regulator with XRE-family HTH domain